MAGTKDCKKCGCPDLGEEDYPLGSGKMRHICTLVNRIPGNIICPKGEDYRLIMDKYSLTNIKMVNHDNQTKTDKKNDQTNNQKEDCSEIEVI